MPRLSQQSLEALRRFVRPEYAGMPAEELEQVIDSSISGLPAGLTEDFMQALGSLGKAVGPTLQRAAPGIAQGAATGASVGGPWGALIGAGAGLASSALSKRGKAPAPTVPAPAGSAPLSAPAIPATSAPTALPTGQGAAATLLSLLQDPTVQQALLSQVLGSSGGERVPTASGTSLPRGAINNLLTQLLANASEGLPESEFISEQDYLRGESGEYLVDPASPEQQAALVLSHLQRTRPARTQAESGDFVDSAEWLIEELADTESAEWLESEESAETVQFY